MSVTPSVPPDDERRPPTVADPADPALRHVSMVGDTYTILLSGEDTGGRFAVVDMLVPAGGGPPPHRHAFEEAFHVLEGELRVTVRGEVLTAAPGVTINVPASAPHSFVNAADAPVRMLCTVAPAGLDAFFLRVGDPLERRDAPGPGAAGIPAQLERAGALGAEYGIEML